MPPRKKEAEDARRARQGRRGLREAGAREFGRPGSKAAGGDLGWATREAYVPANSRMRLFAMQKQGDIVGPVKTQFGYHVIRLDGIETPHVRSFEEVRAELET